MHHDKWDKFYNKRGRFFLMPHEYMGKVIRRFNELNIRRIIDLGCGSGRHLVYLADKGFFVDGIDFSPSAVELARKWLNQRGLKADISVSDIHQRLGFIKDEQYDAILGINSLHYIDIESFINTLSEINRILRTGGLLILSVPSEKAFVKDEFTEQIYFKEKTIKTILEDKFRILDFTLDSRSNFFIIAQEK